MQDAQHFQRGMHAQAAVELAAGRLRIEMAAERDGWHIGALACAARKHRAHVVDGDGAAERLRARLEPVAHLAVEIGQRQTANAALLRRADARRFHQVVPQLLGINLEVCHARNDAKPRPLAASRVSSDAGSWRLSPAVAANCVSRSRICAKPISSA